MFFPPRIEASPAFTPGRKSLLSLSSFLGGLDRANERFPVVWKSVGV